MVSYRVEWKRSAEKELRKLGKTMIPRLLERVAALAENPRPLGSKKVRGSENSYRMRVQTSPNCPKTTYLFGQTEGLLVQC
ncbi:MAG: type II toxin-antitoxin system RelE/ParE family toxin [Sedimenticola sp.]